VVNCGEYDLSQAWAVSDEAELNEAPFSMYFVHLDEVPQFGYVATSRHSFSEDGTHKRVSMGRTRCDSRPAWTGHPVRSVCANRNRFRRTSDTYPKLTLVSSDSLTQFSPAVTK
jgi:hypothetical protein